MIDRNYINVIPDSITNILHDSAELNLSNLTSNCYSQNEFNNLVLNSNLENYDIIK